MKKFMCLLLSLLMTAGICVPAAAVDVTENSDTTVLNVSPADMLADDGEGEFTVTFKQPTVNKEYGDYYKDAYWFAVSKDGDYNYILDEEEGRTDEWKYEHDFLYDEKNDRFVLAKDVIASYFPKDPVYYTVEKMPETMAVAAGEIITFKVMTSPKFNPTTVVVRVAFKAAALHQREQFFHFGFRHGVRIRPAAEHRRRHLVHLLIGALGGQHGRHQHLVRVVKHQLRFRVRIHLFQFRQDGEFLFFLHQNVLSSEGILFSAFQTANRITPFTGNWTAFLMTRVHIIGQKLSFPGPTIAPI